MANQSNNPFQGAGVFTTHTPSSANNLPHAPAWIALEAKNADTGQLEGGDSAAQTISDAHSKGQKVFIWAGSVLDKNVTTADQDTWNKGALAAAQRYGADGVIFSGETPLEMEAAQRAAAGSNMPTAIVGNFSLVPPGGLDPKITAMPEAYLNANEYNSPVNSVATSQRAGATNVLPIFGYYNDGGVHAVVPISTYNAQAQAAGIGNYGVFNAESLAANSNDAQAFNSQPGPTGPTPTYGGPRPQTNVFGGLTTFTAGNPSFGLPLAGSVDGMAVKASGSDATPDAIGTFNTAGVRTYAWAQDVAGDYQGQLASNNQAAAAAAQQGAKGLILPGMDDAQIQAAIAVAQTSQIPVAILTNSGNLAKVPSGTTAMLLGDGLSPQQLAAQAASRANTVPVVAAYDNQASGNLVNQNGSLGQYLAQSGPNVGIFTLDSNRYSQANLDALNNFTIAGAGGALPSAASQAVGVVGPPIASTPSSSGTAPPNRKSTTPQPTKPSAQATPAKPAAFNPAAPAWHQDTRWGTVSQAQAQAGVLEQRPGANGNTVLRMSDGTYKVTHPDGSVTGGGTWNKDQWQTYQAGNTSWTPTGPATSAPTPAAAPTTAPTIPGSVSVGTTDTPAVTVPVAPTTPETNPAGALTP